MSLWHGQVVKSKIPWTKCVGQTFLKVSFSVTCLQHGVVSRCHNLGSSFKQKNTHKSSQSSQVNLWKINFIPQSEYCMLNYIVQHFNTSINSGTKKMCQGKMCITNQQIYHNSYLLYHPPFPSDRAKSFDHIHAHKFKLG